MLLQEWQGFTHIDPIEGDVPAAPFDGRLPLVVSHARAELRGRTRDEVMEIADCVASEFKKKNVDEISHLMAFFPLPVEQLQYESTQYSAAMALMLVNEALRLNGEASAVATIDAQEAITAVVYHQIQEKTFAAAASKKGKDAADAKHKPIKEVKTFALKLAKERHKQDEKMSAWQISDEILGRVEHRAQELGVKLSPDRSRKTIHGWLKTAGY